VRCGAGVCFFFPPLDLRLAVQEEVPESSGGKEQHCFPLWQISTSMHLSTSLKTVPIALWAEGIVFGFFSWSILCYVIMCLVVLLPDQSDETSLRHLSRYCEVFCRSLHNTDTGYVRELCIAEVCSLKATRNLAVLGLLVDTTLHHYSFCFHLRDCHSSMFCDELILFPLCLDRGHSRATITALIGDGVVHELSVLKMLFHHLTLLAPEQTPPYAR